MELEGVVGYGAWWFCRVGSWWCCRVWSLVVWSGMELGSVVGYGGEGKVETMISTLFVAPRVIVCRIVGKRRKSSQRLSCNSGF